MMNEKSHRHELVNDKNKFDDANKAYSRHKDSVLLNGGHTTTLREGIKDENTFFKVVAAKDIYVGFGTSSENQWTALNVNQVHKFLETVRKKPGSLTADERSAAHIVALVLDQELGNYLSAIQMNLQLLEMAAKDPNSQKAKDRLTIVSDLLSRFKLVIENYRPLIESAANIPWEQIYGADELNVKGRPILEAMARNAVRHEQIRDKKEEDARAKSLLKAGEEFKPQDFATQILEKFQALQAVIG